MDNFLGEIRPMPMAYAPPGWVLCDGQFLPVSQNTALFSLIGFTFGGDNKTFFAVPDLRSRIPISSGQGYGLSNYTRGETFGEEQVTLSMDEMGAHSHLVECSHLPGESNGPEGRMPAVSGSNVYGPLPNALLADDSVDPAGAGSEHPNIQPYTAINYIIALTGIYPPRPTEEVSQ
jgi:microcystin-dependent protein